MVVEYKKCPGLICGGDNWIPITDDLCDVCKQSSTIKTKKRGFGQTEFQIKTPLQQAFWDFMWACGLKEYTDAGNPSTMHQYMNWVNCVVGRENISWEDLDNKIDHLVAKYNFGGTEEEFGAKGHRSVICGLIKYLEFKNSKKNYGK